MPSPTVLTLKRLRDHAWVSQVVEQTIRGAGVVFHRDLFSCIDVLAIRHDPAPRILGVQACIMGHVRARLDKAMGVTVELDKHGEPRTPPALRQWLLAGGEFQVWGFAKRGPRGERKRWVCRRVGIAVDKGTGNFVETALEG